MSSDVVFRDPLAGALWRARREATTIAPTDHTELTPVPLQPGRHQVDFGQLGSLHLEVTA